MGRGGWLAVALVFAGVPAAAQEYAGRYAETAEWGRLRAGMPAALERARNAARQRLGLESLDLGGVAVEIEDLPLSASGLVPNARTETRARGGAEVQVIVLHLEPVIAGIEPLETILLHEMAHAALRAALGTARHAAVPFWAREGLAVWAAGQIPDRCDLWLAQSAHEADPVASLVNGLESADHGPRDYPEDGLAVAAIEDAAGAEGVRRFVRMLAEGLPCREAAAGAAGASSWEDFARDARARASRELRARLGDEARAAFAAAVGHVRERRWGEALEAFRGIGAARPGHWSANLAAYYVPRALLELDRPQEAFDAFTAFLQGPGRLTGLLDDAAFHSAGALARLGRAGDALAEYDRLVRDFPWSARLPAAMLAGAELARDPLDRAADALERLQRLQAAFPGAPEAAEARERARQIRDDR